MASYRTARDRYFYLIVALLTVVLFDIYAPQNFSEILSEFIRKQLKTTVSPDLRYLRSLIWFLLLGVSVRYCQAALFMERQYKYLHSLEDQLASHFNNAAFTREGKAYLTNYPVFSNWAHYLYTLVFPVLLIAVIIVRTLRALPPRLPWSGFQWFDLTIGVAICVSVVLYLFAFHGWRVP
jgi:hypothetical protein